MIFTQNVDITVHSVIDNLTDAGLPDGEPEINLFTTKGSFLTEEGKYEIKYDEVSEEYTTHCSLTLDKGKALLSRKGAVVCDIAFEEGKTSSCIYRVPPYAFDMTVFTSKIRNSITENGGEVQLIYSMNIGGHDKKVRMKIKVTTSRK